MKVNRHWVHCVHNSSYSFILILLKLDRCLEHALEMCMWFKYNPQINCCHFLCNLNLVIFGHLYLESACGLDAHYSHIII